MKKHIICFGDSNTHGYCAVTGGRFDENQRWPCLLQKALGEDYQIFEEGLSGRTTSFRDPIFEGLSGLDYLYPCLMTHEPVSLLIIMLGTNDTKERFGASAACIALGLKRLIDKAKGAVDAWADGQPNILVITPQNIGVEYNETECRATMGAGCAEKSRELAEEFRKIASLTGVHYLDANAVVSAGPNQVDYMHLTEEGHRQLAEALAPVVVAAMERE